MTPKIQRKADSQYMCICIYRYIFLGHLLIGRLVYSWLLQSACQCTLGKDTEHQVAL